MKYCEVERSGYLFMVITFEGSWQMYMSSFRLLFEFYQFGEVLGRVLGFARRFLFLLRLLYFTVCVLSGLVLFSLTLFLDGFFRECDLVKSFWIEWIRWRMRSGLSLRCFTVVRLYCSVWQLFRLSGSCFLNWFRRLAGMRLVLVVRVRGIRAYSFFSFCCELQCLRGKVLLVSGSLKGFTYSVWKELRCVQ